MAEDLRRIVAEALDSLEDWKLEAMARLVKATDRRFGVPPYLLGMHAISVEGGVARTTAEVGELHLGPHGAAHGMISFGLLDNVMGAAISSAGRRCVTIELKVQFAKPVLPGSVVAEAEAVHVGGRIAVASGRILDADGDVKGLGLGTYALTDRRLDGLGR